ncbi:MAG: TetR family transcriptional regulator [Actinomycetota bacterium]|nr:TetR family transcriptional regulator [Actinomycetota bacterium]
MSDTAPAARRPGRPPRLSEESVLDAADVLLSSEGVEAVTIRRVAESLGVSAMALYRHVGDKDDLLLALVDRLAQRLEYPPLPADPRERLTALWRTLYEGLAAHLWLPEVLARRRLMAPSVLWAVEEIHVALCDAGLTLERAVVAYRIIWEFTLGALLVRAGISQEAPSVQRNLRGAPDPERYPTLARAAERWRAAHGQDTYLADLGELIGALLNQA